MKINLFKIISLLIFFLLFVVIANAQSSNETKKDVTKSAINNNTKQDNKMDDCPENGVVRLKATFHKSGKATKVEVVKSSGCQYFDNKGIEVAKKIKFEPQIENGKPVTVKKLIEYSFSIKD